MCVILSTINLIIIIIIHILLAPHLELMWHFSAMENQWGKFLTWPQTIPVDLKAKDKHHVDTMDKKMKMNTHAYHPLLRIF